MLKHILIIRKITLFIIPYMFLYGLYVQINGEVSPGGGFQAGVIFASTLIAFDFVNERRSLQDYFSINLLTFIAILGVLIYAVTGLFSLLYNDNFLNYYSLATDKLLAQTIGIFIIEVGVGLTVASVMSLIYSLINYHSS